MIIPVIRRKLFTLGYKVDRRFFAFIFRYLRSMWRHEFVDEPINEFPAHLHMNVTDGHRSGGIGSGLLAAYLDYLRRNGVPGLHLGTTSYNKLAVPFYKKWGFQLVSRHPLTMYEGIIPEEIEVLFFTRKIA